MIQMNSEIRIDELTQAFVYNMRVDELIRQVTIGCIEQGLLLFRIRNELRMTIKYYRKAYESGVIFGLNKAIDAEVKLEKSTNQVRTTTAYLTCK